MDEDTLRSVALGGACAAFVAVPNLGPLLGGGEQAGRYDTVITPPDYAFAIWAPIFAGCVATTIDQCRSGGLTREVSRRTGWPLAAAFAANAMWSVAAQTRFAATPFILPVAAGAAAVAHTRLQGLDPGDGVRLTSASTALLLGWTSLASVVNAAAGAVLAGAQKESRRTVIGSTAALLVAGGGLAGATAVSRRGSVPLAAAAGWGLVTTALTASRPRPVRLAAALATAAVGAATGRRAARTH